MPEPACDRYGAPVEDARVRFCPECRHQLRLEIVRFREALRARVEQDTERPSPRR